MLMRWSPQCDKTAAVNSCQISVVRFRQEVFCQPETSRPVPALHCTAFHYVEDFLHPGSSPAYQSFPSESEEAPQCLVSLKPFSNVPDTTCHRGFCSVSVNRAQPLPLTFPNHVWSHLPGALPVWRQPCRQHGRPKLTFAVCHLLPTW